jgi:hypothetical protein
MLPAQLVHTVVLVQGEPLDDLVVHHRQVLGAGGASTGGHDHVGADQQQLQRIVARMDATGGCERQLEVATQHADPVQQADVARDDDSWRVGFMVR